MDRELRDRADDALGLERRRRMAVRGPWSDVVDLSVFDPADVEANMLAITNPEKLHGFAIQPDERAISMGAFAELEANERGRLVLVFKLTLWRVHSFIGFECITPNGKRLRRQPFSHEVSTGSGDVLQVSYTLTYDPDAWISWLKEHP